MTDFEEEQNQEIEAIESIYPDKLSVIETDPYHVFTMSISSQEDDGSDNTEDFVTSCVIQFTFVEKYPEEKLLFELTETDNLEDEHIERITQLINEQIEENLGMAVVFTIVSAVQEMLRDLAEDAKKRMKDEEERKKQELEEEEQKRFEGTKVTVESFLAWKMKFDAEMAELNKINLQKIQANKKLTGKELFLKDSSMIDSDVKFLESEEDSVEVDESLFQDMDDLELDDEMLEDVGD